MHWFCQSLLLVHLLCKVPFTNLLHVYRHLRHYLCRSWHPVGVSIIISTVYLAPRWITCKQRTVYFYTLFSWNLALFNHVVQQQHHIVRSYGTYRAELYFLWLSQYAFDWLVHSDHCISLANHTINVQSKDTYFEPNLGSDLGSDVQILVRTFGSSSLFLNVRTNVRTSERRFGFGQV